MLLEEMSPKSLDILVVDIHVVVLMLKYFTKENSELLVVPDEKSGDHQIPQDSSP